MKLFLAALVSGLLIGLSFRTVFDGTHLPNLSFLIWIALVPLLLSLRKQSYRQTALSLYLVGVISTALISYWLFHALHHFGGLSPLFSIVAIWFYTSLVGGCMVAGILPLVWLQRRYQLPSIFCFSFGWILFELIRNYGPLGGNPWTNIAYTLAPHLKLIQAADLFGVYGFDF